MQKKLNKEEYLELRLSLSPDYIEEITEIIHRLQCVSVGDSDVLEDIEPIEFMKKENIKIGAFFYLSKDPKFTKKLEKMYQALSKFDCTVTVITDEADSWFIPLIECWNVEGYDELPF
ncbi:hypothetical protein [Enterococcus sp. DIV0385]|uniref:hypothetical protein n=1 Tax=Enterococcus sp. DIV0385 TaxID=2775003 RepID=UPI000A33D0A9|nr:hypothetical protein A5852_000330 [Enterococcus faecium]